MGLGAGSLFRHARWHQICVGLSRYSPKKRQHRHQAINIVLAEGICAWGWPHWASTAWREFGASPALMSGNRDWVTTTVRDSLQIAKVSNVFMTFWNYPLMFIGTVYHTNKSNFVIVFLLLYLNVMRHIVNENHRPKLVGCIQIHTFVGCIKFTCSFKEKMYGLLKTIHFFFKRTCEFYIIDEWNLFYIDTHKPSINQWILFNRWMKIILYRYA